MALPIHSSLVYSPSWYNSNAIDTLEWDHDDKSGVFFYGARNSIYFIKVNEVSDNTKVINDKGRVNVYYDAKLCFFMKAHHEYVVGVCTLPNGILLTKLAKLISCGKDNMIRVWSFDEDVGCCCLKEFNICDSKLKKNVTCISVNDQNVVVCGFEKGFLLSWNYAKDNEFKSFTTESEDIVHMEWRCDKVAIGHKRGLVTVYKMEKYDTLINVTRFQAHNADTCNIRWNPLPSTYETWGDLATVGKDHRVTLWCIDTNHNLKSLKLPNVSRKHLTDATTSNKDSISSWSSLCWSTIDNGTLIISNAYGNLGTWKTLNATELKCFPQNSQTKIHTKSVFGINEFRNYQGLFVSHSLDRTVNITRITESGIYLGCVSSISGLGGSVLSLSGVKHNNQLAVGCGDNIIRLWKHDSIGRCSYDVTNVWNGINGKVLSLSWHPFREDLLAFGTEDGQVGIINVIKDKRIATSSQLHHRSKVFVVSWGVDLRRDCPPDDRKDNLIVYSVGNYALIGHDFRHEQYFEASNYVSDDGIGISDFSVHKSLAYFAVGFGNGVVKIFSVMPLKIVCIIRTHTKSVNCIRWSPLDKGDKLAIGSNERFISVTDLGKVFEEFCYHGDNEWTALDITATTAMLKGHGDRITCIDWSPFDDDKLVSASYDYTAFVWSVAKNSSLANFNCHQGKLLCCHWSKRDPDLIYTGGEDCNLLSWNVSQQSLTTKFNKRRLMLDIPGISKKVDEKKENEVHEPTKSEQMTASVKEQSKPFVKKRASLFPTTLFAVHHALKDHHLSMIKFIEEQDGYLPCMALFGPRMVLMKQIDAELEHLWQEKNYDNYFMILIWVSKIIRVIRESESLQYYPPWLLTVLLAYRTTNHFEHSFNHLISKTITDKDPLLAATYLLSVRKTAQAIDLLISHNCLREAFVLAKLRLNHNDPMIKSNLSSQLQASYFKNGSYELAAMCSLSMANYRAFADTMAKRNTLLASWVVIRTMIKYDQQDLLQQCVMDFVNSVLTDFGDEEKRADAEYWMDVIGRDAVLGHYSLLVDLHRAIWSEQKLFDVVGLLRLGCQKYESAGLVTVQDQLQARLLGKQMNQSECQMCIYITYEFFVAIIRREFGMDEGELALVSLAECVAQLRTINPDNETLKKLTGDVESDDEVVERLRSCLSGLTANEEQI